ncbi:hypothetical protein NKR19_g3647 [Coniochaeta hoffmannii]|uniref:Uncharacterized protein n=1 Tax=Coniochaeta hoffmannii TaxID=91930 RepID=A0AA38W189_9PEZI|nr:hypothetical protein NKR19_g3647 [Coniochaeta hoffmannii]
MGLLSFLSRKSSSYKDQQEAQIISQAYHATTARVPPVRGEYPIGGNGSRNLEGLTKYHALGQSQLRLRLPSPAEEAAPAPVQHIDDPAEEEFSELTAPTLILEAGAGVTEGTATFHSFRADELRPGLPSILGASGTGFKDILDAQSEFKPLDFKSRLKASGARDYGEDVADRNIGENGHNLELPQVQAFYAQETHSDSLRRSKKSQSSKGGNPPAAIVYQKFDSDKQVPEQQDEHTGRPPSSQRSFPLKPSTKRRSGTASSVASSTQGYTAHSVKPSIASTVASYHTAIDTSPPNRHSQRQRADSTRAARRASLPVALVRPDSRDSTKVTGLPPSIKLDTIHPKHQRPESLTPSLRNPATEDIPEPVPPPRTSSLRHWSISSSTTPTTSDTSSNPFSHRPQSRNTATTSVDLGKDFFVYKNTSQLSVTLSSAAAKTPKSSAFNIDDYLSPDDNDDDDNSLEPRIPRGEGEEDLLFSAAGYGSGSQLPGLFDSLASSSPPPRHMAVLADDNPPFSSSSRPRSSTSLPPIFRKPFSPGTLSPRRRYILDTAADSDSDSDSNSDDARSWHGGDAGCTMASSPGGGGKGPGHTRRLSALGSRQPPSATPPEVIEEESDWGKVDPAAAARQRKEEKSRKRAGTASAAAAARRRALKGKGREGEGNEGLADVEC